MTIGTNEYYMTSLKNGSGYVTHITIFLLISFDLPTFFIHVAFLVTLITFCIYIFSSPRSPHVYIYIYFPLDLSLMLKFLWVYLSRYFMTRSLDSAEIPCSFLLDYSLNMLSLNISNLITLYCVGKKLSGNNACNSSSNIIFILVS